MGIRLDTDSVTPDSFTSTVSRPSPSSIWPGSLKRITAPPCSLVLTFTRGRSLLSTRMAAVRGCFFRGSPVGRFTSMVALTSSPAPYALRRNSSFFFTLGGS